PSGGNSATASGLVAQSYTCTATDANGCTTSQSVTLTEPPVLTTTASQVDELCSGANNGSATVNPSGGAGGYTYSWTPSGGSAATASSIYAVSYTCTITDANGCTLTQSFLITEPVTVVASSGPVTNVDCFGNSTGSIDVTQSGGTAPYSYTWSPNVSATNTATGIPAASYTITVTDANGCTNSVIIPVTEPPLLTMQASAAPNVICSGQQVTLSATPGGGAPAYGVNWNPGNMPGNTQNVSPTATTTYSATVTDANGCTSMSTSTVTVNPVPVAAFTSNIVAGCEPVCVNFSDQSTIGAPGVISAWDWDFGDGILSNQQNPQHCYTTPGVYTVILTAKSADGCTHTITMTNYVTVYVNPVAAFSASPQPTTIFNAQIFFTDESVNATSWMWSFGDVGNASSSLQDPTFTYGAPECYQVVLTVTTPNGCSDSISHPVCLDPDISIYVPNAFTPNGNGHNDVFLPSTYGVDPAKYQLWIFDRWGNQIFTTTNINEGWDGRANAGTEICQVDTYVWRIVATDIQGNPHALVGSINLIR
ncbi:MAG TPA: PKD domain-containing protein, partial [Bacteroidia bacterium]|nr:PKD domain-containing protein [Bacteroidia bacterium]